MWKQGTTFAVTELAELETGNIEDNTIFSTNHINILTEVKQVIVTFFLPPTRLRVLIKRILK